MPNTKAISPGNAGALNASDRRVQAAVRHVLNSSPWSDLTHVEHEIEGHVIRLRGAVSSFYLKQMAHSVVARACRGFEIDNGVSVVNRK